MNKRQQTIAKRDLNKARQYAKDVQSGKILACKWVKLAVERDESDRIHGDERDLFFDEYKAGLALVVFSYFQHYKGSHSVFEPEPWQCWIISVVFGWVNKNGTRRFREVYEEVPRKNGKTFKLSVVAVILMVFDKEAGPEVYSAASRQKQAKILWNDAKKIIEKSPQLRQILHIQKSENLIECQLNDGRFEPLSRESEGIEGTNPHGGLIDELHAHKTADVYNAVLDGMGARKQPLLWAITTAGIARPVAISICLQKQKYAKDVLQGFKDDTFFGIIYTLDDPTELHDEKKWIKANPNLIYKTTQNGKTVEKGSVKADYLRRKVDAAKHSPVFRYSTLTKNFNVWQSNDVKWANMQIWRESAYDFPLESLNEADKVFIGMDLGSVSDLTSITFLAEMPDGELRLCSRSWIPEDAVDRAIIERGVNYELWIEQEWLIPTPGRSTDYSFIHQWLYENAINMPIELIAIDDWALHQFAKDISADFEGKLAAMRQGFKSISPAMKEFERMYLSHKECRFIHENNPVLDWAMQNTVAVLDPNENIKPDKKKSAEKIDPVAASIIAFGAKISTESDDDYYPSAYEGEVYL